MRWQKLNRWSRKLFFGLAAFPMLQAATCDANQVANSLVSTSLSLAAQLNVQVAQLAIAGVTQSILQAFPGANIIQILLGGNQQPFFP